MKITQAVKTLIIKMICSTNIGNEYWGKYYRPWRERQIKRMRSRLLHQYGLEILKKVYDVLTPISVPYFAMYGTLLGCVRENGFIPHDDDVDFGICPGFADVKSLVVKLIEHGFIYKRAFLHGDVITEVAFTYKGVPVDFFFNFKDVEFEGKMWAHCYSTGGIIPQEHEKHLCLRTIRTYAPNVTSIKKVFLDGVPVFIPENYEEVLKAHYGRNWRIPDANWTGEAEGDYCIRKDIKSPASYVIGIKYLMDL